MGSHVIIQTAADERLSMRGRRDLSRNSPTQSSHHHHIALSCTTGCTEFYTSISENNPVKLNSLTVW